MRQIDPGTGGVQQIQSPNVALAGESKRSQARGWNAIAEVSDQFVGLAKEWEQDDATTKSSLNYSNYVAALPADDDYVSGQQALDLGAQDSDNLYETVEGVRQLKSDIPAWQLKPELLKAKYDQIVTDEAANLSGYGAREGWLNARKRAGAEMYAEMSAARTKKYFEARVATSDAAIQAAQEAGDFEMALSHAMNYPIIEEQDAKILEVNQGADTNRIYATIQSGDPAAMVELANELDRSETYLEPRQEVAFAAALRQQAKTIEGSATNKRIREYDVYRTNVAVAEATGDYATALTQLVELETKMLQRGDEAYFDKGFFPGQYAKIFKGMKNSEGDQGIGEAWLTGPQGGKYVFNPQDADHRKIANKLVDDSIKAAVETGDPEILRQTHQQNISLAASNGMMPGYYSHMFETVNSPNADPLATSGIVGMYTQFEELAPHLLSDVDDKNRLFVEDIKNISFNGVPTEDAINEVRQKYSTTTAEQREVRLRDWQGFIQNEENLKKAFNQKAVAATDTWYTVNWARGFTTDAAEIGMGDDVYTAFEGLTKHYFMMGADMPTAQNAAFGKVTSAYGPSKSNGYQTWMRNPPERAYNMTPEDVRSDFVTQLRGHMPGLGGYKATDFSIMADQQSATEGPQPSYAVFWTNEYGVQDLVRDQNNVELRYTPDPVGVAGRKYNQDLKTAEYDREMDQAGYMESTSQSKANAEYAGYDATKERYERSKFDKQLAKSKTESERAQVRIDWADRRAKEVADDRARAAGTLREVVPQGKRKEDIEIPDTEAEFLDEMAKIETGNKLYAIAKGGMSADGSTWSAYKSHEGGTDTIGIGHKLSAEENRSRQIEWKNKRYNVDNGIPNSVAREIYKDDVDKKKTEIRKTVNGFDKLEKKYQLMLVNIAFNTGSVNEKSWPKLLAAMRAGDDAEVRKQSLTHVKGKPIIDRRDRIANVLGIDKQEQGLLARMGF